MTQKKIGDILYVFSTTPFEITQDTDATTIRVQQECLEGYKSLNASIASKIVPFNYHVMVATVQEWNEYVDASGESEVNPVVGPYFHLFDNYGGFEAYSGLDQGWDDHFDFNENWQDTVLSEGTDALCSYLAGNYNVTAKLYNDIDQYKDPTTGEYDEVSMEAGALHSTSISGGGEYAEFIFVINEENNDYVTLSLNNGSGLKLSDDSNYLKGKMKVVITPNE